VRGEARSGVPMGRGGVGVGRGGGYEGHESIQPALTCVLSLSLSFPPHPPLVLSLTISLSYQTNHTDMRALSLSLPPP
jgi:hypothetical protein